MNFVEAIIRNQKHLETETNSEPCHASKIERFEKIGTVMKIAKKKKDK